MAQPGSLMQRQLGLWDAAGDDSAWRIRESRRARRLSARVFRDGSVEVVVPRGTRPNTVAGFISRHRGWIERQRRRLPLPVPQQFPPAQVQLAGVGESWDCRIMAVDTASRIEVTRQPNRGASSISTSTERSIAALQTSSRNAS